MTTINFNKMWVLLLSLYLMVLGAYANAGPLSTVASEINSADRVGHPACSKDNATLAVMAFNGAKFVALAISNCASQMLVTVTAAGMQKESGELVWGDGTFVLPPNTMTALEIDVSRKENLQIKSIRSKALIAVTSALEVTPELDLKLKSDFEYFTE